MQEDAMNNLSAKTLLSLVALAISTGLLIFVPAGTVRYWQAWAYLATFMGASFFISLYLIKRDPALLKRRLSGGPTAERSKRQKLIMLFASIGFIGLLIVPALDNRLGWSMVPLFAVIVGDFL
jgi:hypothetical protein